MPNSNTTIVNNCSDIDHEQFTQTLRARYRDYEGDNHNDPFISPVLRLSLDISRMLDKDEITLGDLEKSISKLSLDGLSVRAQRMKNYFGTCNEAENLMQLETVFRKLALPSGADGVVELGEKKSGKGAGDIQAVSFEEFQKRVSHLFYGFVFTAHPTFSMSRDLSRSLSSYAAGLAGAENSQSFEDLEKAAHVRYKAPNIHEETHFSLEAISNLHDAFEKMFAVLFSIASDLYPDQWLLLRPSLCSVATWVGFDIDGRKDIQWATTLEKRIELQVHQLKAYDVKLAKLLATYPDDVTDLGGAAQQVKQTLESMRLHHKFFASYDQEGDEGLKTLQEGSRALIASTDKRLLTSAPLIEAVQKCLHACSDKELQIELLVFLAQLHNFGLSRAQVHFRINSNQLHNAISNDIRLATHPDHTSSRRGYIESITELMDKCDPMNIHFGDIADEDMTARYEFMLIQQILEHIDSESPIRFLIAETESAFTILTALYYAKMFGVEKHIDICPLIETGRALQNCSRYIDVLLKNQHFSEYLKVRRKLCIQTGYSDAGRYIGQPAAGGSIERLKERLVSLFRDNGMTDMSLLFFDTHGESFGRGGHPDGFGHRLRYICSPYFMHKLAKNNVGFTQESSYQGGDGFLPFANGEITLAIVTRVFEYFLQDFTQPMQDPYYEEPYRSEVTEFFTVATAFQHSLISDPHYAELLGAFSTNLMHPSGSRAVKRTGEVDGVVERPDIRQFRAIPHNAILGQFGLCANTISGIGRAFREHSDFASDLGKSSSRFQEIMSLVDRGFSLSDPQIMKAYISILDPTFWIAMAQENPDQKKSNKLAALATHLEEHGFHDGMMSIFRKLAWDYTLLSRVREKNNEHADSIACLHAMRIALMRHSFLLAMDIPRYSGRHGVSRDQLISVVLRMDIDQATHILNSIFPTNTPSKKDYDFGEESDYQEQNDLKGYHGIHNDIVKPLRRYQMISRNISAALAHYMGFFG